MKARKKKLALKKTTISHLNVGEMKNANGGEDFQIGVLTPECPPTTGCAITPACPTTGHVNTVCQATCASYTGGPNSDPCCIPC
jgi:hypothetical protein